MYVKIIYYSELKDTKVSSFLTSLKDDIKVYEFNNFLKLLESINRESFDLIILDNINLDSKKYVTDLVKLIKSKQPFINFIFCTSSKINDKKEEFLLKLNISYIYHNNRCIKLLKYYINNIKYTRSSMYRDNMTSCLNRNMLEISIKRSIYNCNRRKDLYDFLIFIDLDKFKPINDKLGHCIGDKFLKRSSKIFHKSVRECDEIFRFGGDEFVILLKRLTQESALLILKRLVNYFKKDKVLNRISHKVNSKDPSLSSGLIKIDGSDDSKSIMTKADFLMYKSKSDDKDIFSIDDDGFLVSY